MNGIDTAKAFPAWPSKLNGLIKTRGSLYGGSWQLDVPELKLNGNVKNNKVNVAGQLKGNSYLQWIIPGLHLELGRNRADIKGELGVKDLNLDANIDAPAPDNALPGLGGTAKGVVNIRGTVDAPQALADITANNLRWQDLSVARVRVDGDVTSSDQIAGKLNVRVERIAQPGVNWAPVTLAAEGEKQHTLQLRVQGEPVSGQLDLAGSFDRRGAALERLAQQYALCHPGRAVVDQPANHAGLPEPGSRKSPLARTAGLTPTLNSACRNRLMPGRKGTRW